MRSCTHIFRAECKFVCIATAERMTIKMTFFLCVALQLSITVQRWQPHILCIQLRWFTGKIDRQLPEAFRKLCALTHSARTRTHRNISYRSFSFEFFSFLLPFVVVHFHFFVCIFILFSVCNISPGFELTHNCALCAYWVFLANFIALYLYAINSFHYY